MADDFAETDLGRLFSFANGRSSPERADGLPYPVYGSNGVIGYASEANAGPGSIIIGRVGSYCGSLYLSKQKCWVTDNAIRATALDDNDPRFLFYLLGTLSLNNWRAGSGQPLLNQDILSRIPAAVPEPAEQRAIAHILGTLDDKIELNRRMNETLEAMAQAIFKSWFVDFDPVRAKTESRDPHLPKEIADLFPSVFEDSELGQIPRGWKVGMVADLGKIICGKTPPTVDRGNYGDDVPFITIPDMHGRVFVVKTSRRLSYKGAQAQPTKTLPPCSICVSCIATPGLVSMTCEPSQTNQQINSVIPTHKRNSFYCYFLLRGLADQITARGSGGSVVTNLNRNQFSLLPALIPSQETMPAFDEMVTPLLLAVLANDNQSITLAAVRETLLPKLLSGEIRVKKAKKSREAMT